MVLNLKLESIGKMKKTEKQKDNQKDNRKQRYRVGAVLCGVIFLGALLFIGVYVGRQRQAEREYEAMREAQRMAEAEAAEEQAEVERRRREQEEAEAREAAEKKSDAPHLENTIDFETLQAENSDIYAWIQIPGTQVDYPILQHPTDDSYYLNYTPEGVSGLPGSIYTESVHPKDFSAPLTVIYGHNMRNDTMFGSLHDYEDPDKLEESPYVYIYLPDRTLVYQIFAAVRFSDAYLPAYCDYEEEEDFLSFTEELCSSEGNVNEEVEVPYGSRLIVMSTCIGSAPSNRFLVAAVQIDDYER